MAFERLWRAGEATVAIVEVVDLILIRQSREWERRRIERKEREREERKGRWRNGFKRLLKGHRRPYGGDGPPFDRNKDFGYIR